MAAARCGSKLAVPAGCVGARAGGPLLLSRAVILFHYVILYHFFRYSLSSCGFLRFAFWFFFSVFSASPAGGGSPGFLLGPGGLRFWG